MVLENKEQLEVVVRDKLKKVIATITGLQNDIAALKKQCQDSDEQIRAIDAEIARSTEDYQQLTPLLDDLTNLLDQVNKPNSSNARAGVAESKDAKSAQSADGNVNNRAARKSEASKRKDSKRAKATDDREDRPAKPSGTETPQASKDSSSSQPEQRPPSPAKIDTEPAVRPSKKSTSVDSELAPIVGEFDEISHDSEPHRPSADESTSPADAGQSAKLDMSQSAQPSADKPWLQAAAEGRRRREEHQTSSAPQQSAQADAPAKLAFPPRAATKRPRPSALLARTTRAMKTSIWAGP